MPKPGHLDEWGSPPTYHGYQGGDLIGVVEHLDYLVDLGVNAVYFTPIFQSASNHRYHTHDYEKVDPMLGGNAALRRLIDEAHARGHPGRARRRLQPRQPGLLPVPRHPRERLRTRPTSTGSPSTSFPLNAYDADKSPELQGLVGPARPAQVQHRLPRGARVPLGDRPEVDRVRHRRLAARRPQRDRRRRVLARVPPPGPGRQPRGLHRRRGLDRRPALAPGGHVGRRDELSVHPRLHRLLHRRGRRPRRAGAGRASHPVGPDRRRGVPPRDRAAARPLSPERHVP